MLRKDAKAFLQALTEREFNPFGRQDRLYTNYIRPRILRFLATIETAEPVALDYFCTMTSFLQREQFFAKVGDQQSPSDRSFARTWLCDTEKKRTDGDIITHLRLEPVYNEKQQPTHLRAFVREGDHTESNFREGDSVLLYECNSDGDSIVNRQTMRCYIEAIHPDSFLLRLAHPQRYLPPLTSLYAIEPSHSDSLFSTQYRGLYALLSAPRRRRNLLLGQVTPTAEDFYLLIGPPGSGKTNITLRNMVEDVRTRFPEENILLMAYTNRAVDEICQMLEGTSRRETYVRIGAEYSCGADYRPRLMANFIANCRNRSEILERLRPVRIICGTVYRLFGTPEL
ncbi:MAG: AAA family ATPase, partial [Bacteroidaceae bacterium]|nr:AAA family ATPase [Bacteroidaceae bacterium]